MIESMVVIVLLPVLAGMGLNYFFPELTGKLGTTVAPLVSVLAVTVQRFRKIGG